MLKPAVSGWLTTEPAPGRRSSCCTAGPATAPASATSPPPGRLGRGGRAGPAQHEGRGIGLHPGQHPLAVAELAEADAEEARGGVPGRGNATTVDGVSLNLGDTGALLASARAKAVADAKAKAIEYARASGQQLGPVVSISGQSSPEPFLPFAAAAQARWARQPRCRSRRAAGS